MSRIAEVIANKNKIERAQKARQREEMNSLRGSAAYKAALNDELNHLDVLLNSNEVTGVVVKVKDAQLSKFGEAIYSEALSSYEVEQVPGEPDKFIIRQRLI